MSLHDFCKINKVLLSPGRFWTGWSEWTQQFRYLVEICEKIAKISCCYRKKNVGSHLVIVASGVFFFFLNCKQTQTRFCVDVIGKNVITMGVCVLDSVKCSTGYKNREAGNATIKHCDDADKNFYLL